MIKNYYDNSPFGNIPVSLDVQPQNDAGKQPTRHEKRRLMLQSIVVGLCVVSFMGLRLFNGWLLLNTGVGKLYVHSQLTVAAFDIIFSVICIFIPFLIGGVFLKRIEKNVTLVPLKAPNSKVLFVLAMAIGMMAAIFSNYITGMFVFIMEKLGVALTSPHTWKFTGGFWGFVRESVRGALVPALVEEFAMRGIIMQPLRKYGDKFAIIMSSLIFAFMHGNMIQAPFAFLLGYVIGYLVIKTQSLWTGVAIHFLNNWFAVIMSIASTYMGEWGYLTLYSSVSMCIIAIGSLAMIAFILLRKRYPVLYNPAGREYLKTVSVVYLLTPPMIAAIGIMIYNSFEYISFGG